MKPISYRFNFEKPFVTVLPNEADSSTIVVKPKLYHERKDAPIKREK